jgi:hypothetical protein
MEGLALNAFLAVALSISTVGSVYSSQNKHISTDAPKAYTAKTGKTIVVSETQTAGRSLSTIEVHTEAFEYNFMEVFENRDPISDVFVVDLGGNGFDEIYIVTQRLVPASMVGDK